MEGVKKKNILSVKQKYIFKEEGTLVEKLTICPERDILGVGTDQSTSVLIKLLKSFIAHFSLRSSCSFPPQQCEKVKHSLKIFAKYSVSVVCKLSCAALQYLCSYCLTTVPGKLLNQLEVSCALYLSSKAINQLP